MGQVHTHWGLTKINPNFQTTFSNQVSCIESTAIWNKFGCALFPAIWTKAGLVYWRIYASSSLVELDMHAGLLQFVTLWLDQFQGCSGLCPANDRRSYKITPSLIGWAQTYYQPSVRNRFARLIYPYFSGLLLCPWCNHGGYGENWSAPPHNWTQ